MAHYSKYNLYGATFGGNVLRRNMKDLWMTDIFGETGSVTGLWEWLPNFMGNIIWEKEG